MSQEQHQIEHQPQRTRKGRWLAYVALLTFVVLALLILLLSPPGTRGDVLLRFLAIVASWPVVAGVVLIAFFTSFRPEISSYMKFAKVKYGEFEVSAEQSQTPTAVLGAVAIEAKAVGSAATEPVDEHERITAAEPDHSEIKAWLGAELEKREIEAMSWKNVFLDQFLVEGAKGALVWFHNFTAVPESFYHAKLETFIPDPQKRSRILQTLLELALVRRSGDLLSITDEGTKYVEHLYASAAGGQVRHPFISREDVQQYGRWNIHGDNGGEHDDMCHHRDMKVKPQSSLRRQET